MSIVAKNSKTSAIISHVYHGTKLEKRAGGVVRVPAYGHELAAELVESTVDDISK